MEVFKNNKYLVGAMIFALLNMGAIFLIFGFQQYGDSQEYVGVIHFFQGEETEVVSSRILRPLGPLLAVPFEFLGNGAGLIAQNIIFYLLCAFLIFKITELIYQNKRQAFFASLFFVTATPVIEVGLAYLTDAGGWFFFLLSVFLTLLYFKNKSRKLISINGFLSGVGFLMKESGAIGAPFFGLMVLFSKVFSPKQKILKIICFAVFLLIPVVTVQFLILKYFNYTSLDWWSQVLKFGHAGEGWFLPSLRYLGQLFRILGILWPFILIGLWREWHERNWQRIKIFLALLPSSFLFLLWSPGAGVRPVFLFAPLGILLATYGLSFIESKLSKKKGALLVTLLLSSILVLNYTFCWFNRDTAFFDIIAEFFGIL